MNIVRVCIGVVSRDIYVCKVQRWNISWEIPVLYFVHMYIYILYFGQVKNTEDKDNNRYAL